MEKERSHETVEEKTKAIAELNDQLRRTFVLNGAVVCTSGIQALAPQKVQRLLSRIHHYDNFTPDNDPCGEHDFGVIEEGGEKTYRLLTIMLAEEY